MKEVTCRNKVFTDSGCQSTPIVCHQKEHEVIWPPVSLLVYTSAETLEAKLPRALMRKYVHF